MSFLELSVYGLWVIIFTLTFCMFYEGNIMKLLYFNWVWSFLCGVVPFYIFYLKKSCRLELLKERERRKEEEVEALKRSMQAGLVRLFFLFLLAVLIYLLVII